MCGAVGGINIIYGSNGLTSANDHYFMETVEASEASQLSVTSSERQWLVILITMLR